MNNVTTHELLFIGIVHVCTIHVTVHDTIHVHD